MSGVQLESDENGSYILVDSQAALDAALARVSGGETIAMKAGEYDSIRLHGRDFASKVNIISADDDNPAVLTGVIKLNSVSGLSISGVDLIGDEALPAYTGRVHILHSSDIRVSDMQLTGVIRDETVNQDDPSLTKEEALMGAPVEWGVRLDYSERIEIDNLDITVFARGIYTNKSNDLTLTNNEIHDLRSDGINIGAGDNILIEGNYLHDFRPWYGPSHDKGDHPDFIQYYAPPGEMISNLIIRDNVIRQGEGGHVQGIFGHYGNSQEPSPLYTGFDISNNFIEINHLHGISLRDITDSRIVGNVLIPSGKPMWNDPNGWRPEIRIGTGNEKYPAQNIEISDNLMTLGWQASLDPTGLGAEENAARNITYTDNTFLEHAPKVSSQWAGIELPDPNTFTDYASWYKAALVAIGVEPPAPVVEELPEVELPPAIEDLPPAELPSDPAIHVVEEEKPTREIEIGGGDIDDLDFSNGDSLIFRGDFSTPIASLDDLYQLARRDDVRLDIPEGSDFRLVIDEEDGPQVVNISLAGEAAAARDISGAMSADRGVVRNDNERHFDVLANDALGEDAMIIGHAESAMGARVETDGKSLIYQAMNEGDPGIHLDTIRYAVTDGEGGFGVSSMTVRVVNKAAFTEKGGRWADRIITSGDDDVIAARAGRDVVRSGGGDDWLKGGRGHDRLIAGDGDDILQGGRGRDLLDGGRGSDLMIGGRGGDQFRFNARNMADGDHDTIVDLNFAAGDTLKFVQFDRGTFSGQEFRANAKGRAVEIDNMDDLMAMENVKGASFTREDDHVVMTMDIGSGKTSEIDLHFAGKSATAFDEFWAEM